MLVMVVVEIPVNYRRDGAGGSGGGSKGPKGGMEREVRDTNNRDND